MTRLRLISMTPRALFVVASLLAVAALAAPRDAQAVTYNITLDAAQEVPAPTLGGATPSGSATVTVNTITGATTISGSYAGMTSAVNNSHLHGLSAPGTPSGVIFGLTHTAGTSGTFTGNSTLSAANLTGLLNGLTYVNVHTANNGPGEIRGQVVDPDIKVFNITLDAAQEVPAPTLGGATPSGTARVVYDMLTGEVEITGTYAGMTSAVNNAHLHGLAPPGTPAGVLFGLTFTGGTSGTFSGSGTLSGANLAGLLNGQTYINVHTANNGPGEIRGQVPAVPEPATIALLGGGLLALAMRRRCK